MLYEELLASCHDKLSEFFKNVTLFENQFSWSDFNQSCYDNMYANNNIGDINKVKDLKDIIPDLADTCKKCGAFFMPARNKSVPKYDVILAKQLEDALMDFLADKLGVQTGRADLDNRSLPDCKVLKADGSVAAYFELKYHAAPFIMAYNKIGRFCYEGSATLDYKKIKKQLCLINDGLDAPVFYVHWIDYPCLKGVFFETSEQVEKYISEQHETFERKKREGDDAKSAAAVYLTKIYSPLLEMGDFDQFLEILRSLISK